MKKFAAVLAILALIPFAFAACGDDEDDGGDTEAPATTTEAEAPAGGGSASTLEFSADPGGDLAYEQDSAETEAGDVTVEFTNDSSVPHDVRFEGPEGEDVGGTDEITGDETSTTVSFEAGDYTFYCSVPGHREAGMEGPLTVE